ncbi:hypothetical protein G6F42_016219 [Rhizopus arrhizus]|nr:hypothetical protein G6F42_016219 [Rhizopus arrhizus]
MFIEPAMLLMERSAERYAHITASLMQFLKRSVDEYFPPMKDYMSQCVACGMRVMLSKGVIRSLLPIYRCPATDQVTRDYMQALFSEFLVEDAHQQAQGPPSLPSSVTMHTSAPLPPSSTATIERPTTPKAEPIVDVPSEQDDDGEIEQGKKGATDAASKAIKEDDDEDAFLYGESDTNSKTQVVQEDEDMENASDTETTEATPAPTVDVVAMETGDSKVEEMAIVDADEEQMATDDDYEDDDESAEGLQSNQSYWIFGDSLKRFKEASKAVRAAQKDADMDEYNIQILIVKRSLKEILAVFLRMAIPAETLAITVGPSIRNMVSSNLLNYAVTAATDDESMLADSTKDAFDLVMSTFWSVRTVDASRDKLVSLIGCIAHTPKTKGKRHVIGMRWWAFIAAQLQNDTDAIDVWFPNILKNYETYVLHAYTIEESEMDQSEYLKVYLRDDLEMLAEYSVALFNTIIPLIYQYLPHATVGNSELLKTTLLVLLPDALGKITCSLHFGNIRIFGDSIDTRFLEAALSLPAYETMYYWQLLAAEIQGKTKRIEEFFQQDQVAAIFKTKLKQELMPSLMSILTSTQPSKDLIHALIHIVPKEPTLVQPQAQLVLTCLQYWSIHATESFGSSLNELIVWFIDLVESESNESEDAAMLLSLLMIWWHQKSASETFKNNKLLLSKAYVLSNLIGHDCPKEWNQELPRKKKRSIFLDSDEDDDV